jgi:hypothetical protein
MREAAVQAHLGEREVGLPVLMLNNNTTTCGNYQVTCQ